MRIDKTVLCLLFVYVLVACTRVAQEICSADRSWRVVRRRAIDQGALFAILCVALLYLGYCTHFRAT